MHHSILPHPIVKFQRFSPFHRKSRQNISYQCERPDDIASSKSPRQSFPAQGRENKSKSVFPGDMRIGKNTSQPASVASGRPLTRFCMQRAASPLKNAGIFEKRVELVRHAKYPGPGEPGPGYLVQRDQRTRLRAAATTARQAAQTKMVRTGTITQFPSPV